MSTISEQLTQLQTDKDNLVNNLTTKGISGLTGDETFTELVPEVLELPRDWSDAGYSSEPQFITDGIRHAKTIKDNWTSTSTCKNDLDLIFMPMVTVSERISFLQIFAGCENLIYIPPLETSLASNFIGMCNNCSSLKNFPQLKTDYVQNWTSCWAGCTALESIPLLNAMMCTRMQFAFQKCSKLTALGGFQDLGYNYDTSKGTGYNIYTIDFSASTALTHDSLMNVINNLYDIASKGCNAQQLVLGSTNLAKLTAEEIAIATNKGWTIS